MTDVNATALNKKLMELYLIHYGTPHTHKAFKEQSASLKQIAKAVGEENVILTFKYLLKSDKDWLQASKNIPGLVRFFDAIQTMRLNDGKHEVCASMSQVRRVQTTEEAKRLEKYRKEILGDDLANE